MPVLFKVRFNPEAMVVWNALPPRTRGNLEKQLNGMAMLIGFRELMSDSERYGSVRIGKVEVLYELDTSARLLCAYEVRRHGG
jgi:mRNA-degrading endonuclease RelE of RelBE toxin-antitoxin system